MVTSDSESGKLLCCASITASGATSRDAGRVSTVHTPPILVGATRMVFRVELRSTFRVVEAVKSTTARNCGPVPMVCFCAANSSMAMERVAATTEAWIFNNLKFMNYYSDDLLRKSGAQSCRRVTLLIRCMQPRSEEHTSELQSPYDLVCRLLLEKKKQKNIKQKNK